jgi:hypothetical protein
MQQAAIGVRAHSGWGAMVAVTKDLDLLARHRISITEASTSGANQPYHFAQSKSLPDAQNYLTDRAAISHQLAFEALRNILDELRQRDFNITDCAILLASGRPLPELARILASHSLIHTAEGEFFRNAFCKAGEQLNLRITRIPERDLETRAEKAFGRRASQVHKKITGLGKSVGPPWTTDQKTASLAALLALETNYFDNPTSAISPSASEPRQLK